MLHIFVMYNMAPPSFKLQLFDCHINVRPWHILTFTGQAMFISTANISETVIHIEDVAIKSEALYALSIGIFIFDVLPIPNVKDDGHAHMWISKTGDLRSVLKKIMILNYMEFDETFNFINISVVSETVINVNLFILLNAA